MNTKLTLFRGPPLGRPTWNSALNRRPVPVRAAMVAVHAVRRLEYWIAPDRQLRVITGLSIRWSLMVAIPATLVVLPTLWALKLAIGVLASIVAVALTVVTTLASVLLGLIVAWALLEVLAALAKWSKERHGETGKRRR